MSLLTELMSHEGVFAAVEFSYHGDRFDVEGELTPEQARWASVMARAHNMGVHMQAGMLEAVSPAHGFAPLQAWQVRGAAFTVCGMANVFCFVDHRVGTVNAIMRLLRERLHEEPPELIY